MRKQKPNPIVINLAAKIFIPPSTRPLIYIPEKDSQIYKFQKLKPFTGPPPKHTNIVCHTFK